MNEIIIKENKKIEDLIYEIRGKHVMIDSDLSTLFKVPTKAINQAVSRNINKFPNEFSFKLNDYEQNIFWSQFVTKNNNYETRGGKYKKPRVFTEQGIVMLASILKSDIAVKMSVEIVKTFVAMRRFINNNREIFTRVITIENDIQFLSDKQKENEDNFEYIFDKLENKEHIKEKLFLDGQIYDAYSLLINIIMEAKKNNYY